jgi:ribonuclease HI
MADRTEIHTDGTFNDQSGIGGWATVIARSTAGRQPASAASSIFPPCSVSVR